MLRYTSAEYLAFWKSIPGTFADKKEAMGGPFVYARQMAAADAEMSDEEVMARYNESRAERDAEIALRSAFERYFASTPEGQEEGRWLNVVHWQWAAAGSPPKIPVGGHPMRKLTFAKFEAEWLAHTRSGTPMTMVAPPAPSKRTRRYAF